MRYDYPDGAIVEWNGELTEIPDGWAICDGNNGTPDLLDRYVVGAGFDGELGNTTGTNTINGVSVPSHSHSTSGGSLDSYSWEHEHGAGTDDRETDSRSGQYWWTTSDAAHSGDWVAYESNEVSLESCDDHTHSGWNVHTGEAGGDESLDNRPPSVELTYIKKLT